MLAENARGGGGMVLRCHLFGKSSFGAKCKEGLNKLFGGADSANGNAYDGMSSIGGRMDMSGAQKVDANLIFPI